MRRLALAIAAATALTTAAAWAYWTTNSAAGSTGAAGAASVNAGATPTASVTATGREVGVSWGASTLSNGTAVSGYLVKRYPSGGGVPTISPVGSCSGTVVSTSCAEDDVPAGAWVYTVTPVVANWHGAESSTSGVATIAAAALTVNGSPFGNAAFTPATANATGAITGFAGGENVAYHLDGSTALTGSPTSVGADGSATITSLGIPKSAGDGAHTVSGLGDAPYAPSSASAGIVIDTTAPTVSAQLSPTPNAAGWNNSSPVSVALAADDGVGSGINRIRYTTDGSDPTTSGTAQTYSAPFDVAAQGTTAVKYYATDVAGNATAVQAQPVKIDTGAPANSLSLTSVSGGVYPTGGPLADGTTVYYRGTAAGSFRISNAVSDAVSGPASSATTTLAGGSGGWSHAASLASTPAGGPYVSNPFSWNAGTTSSPSETVTGGDVADNFASTTLNLVDDSTGPSGGSVDATGLGGTGGRYAPSTTLSIALAKGTDSGAGVSATGSTLLRASATLTSDGIADGACGTFGSSSQVAIDPVSPYTDNAAGGISSGHCYRYEYVVPDRVGNTTTYTSGAVEVDASGPSAPSITLSSASGNTYINGGVVYINSQSGRSGSFQASATSSDSDSGILKLNFPSPGGFSSGGGDDTASPYSSGTYNWSGAVSASGSQTVTASNNANLSSSAGFTITPDTTNPTGGALTVNGTAATGGGSTSYSNSGAFNINAISDYGDSGSGLASSTLTRQSATLSSSDGVADGSCGSYGGATTISSRSTPISQTLSGPTCYLYTLTGTDNVGNTTSISTTVKVDTSGPSAPSITLSSASGNTYINGGVVYINSQSGRSGSFQASATSSDSDSGILKLNFPSPGGFSSGGGDDTASPYSSGTYNWSGAVSASGSQTVTASNNANLSSSAGFTITPDTTNPTGGALTVNGTAATGGGSTSSTTNAGFLINSRTNYSDAGSGIGSSTLTVQSETLTSNSTCGAAGSGGPYTSPTTIGGTSNPAITVGYCYLYTLTGTDNVGNTTSISTTVKVPFAGIDWASITTSNNKTVNCNYTTITAVTCSVSGVGNGGTFTANVRLIDPSQNSVNNTTGSTITVTQTTTGQGSSSPASTTIAQNAGSSAGSFTLTLNNGGNKTATITASVTVNGVTFTVTCAVST
jgi:hypothetical protein